MHYFLNSIAKAGFIFGVLWASTTTFSQSLVILKETETNFWIEASAPADNPHTLQASENLLLWADVRENVTARISVSVTNVGRSQHYFRLKPSEPPPPPIRVMLLGDSMGSDCCGWGRGLYGYFKENATVINYAFANSSTRYFLQSAEKENMLLIKPDYVLINYGYMDNSADTSRNTTLEEFDQNLRTIVEMVRSFGGVPILIPVHAPRVWDAHGKVIRSAGMLVRNSITKQVSEDLNILFIDLFELTLDLYNELGPTRTAALAFELFPGDPMHISQLGGEHFSRLVVNALPESFGPYLDGTYTPPPIP